MLDIPKRLHNAFSNPKTSVVKANTGMYPASASVEVEGQLYGACHRAEYYRWYRYAPTSEVDPEMSLTAKMGEALHEFLTSVLLRSVAETDIVVLSNEQGFFDSKELLSGRTDLFLKDLKTGKLHGCDIKSVGDFKAGMVCEEPSIEHLLQCAIYLDQYNKSAKINNSRPVEDWIILYIARSENWKLKKYPHGSMFKYLWQFSLDLKKDYVTVTNQFGAITEYPDITIEAINARYRILLDKIRNKQLPDRDYEYKYSEERLTGMHKQGKLNKGQTAEIKKWLDDGAKEGELALDMGDFPCRYCNWTSLCYSSTPDKGDKAQQVLYNIPKDIVVPQLSESVKNKLENLL